MGLVISRPSVFVWGPEACLSTGFRRFLGKAHPLRRKIVFAVASIALLFLHGSYEFSDDVDISLILQEEEHDLTVLPGVVDHVLGDLCCVVERRLSLLWYNTLEKQFNYWMYEICSGNITLCAWHIVVNALPCAWHYVVTHWLNNIMPCAGKCVNNNMPCTQRFVPVTNLNVKPNPNPKPNLYTAETPTLPLCLGWEISRFEANFPKYPALPLEFDFLPLKLRVKLPVFHIKLW